MMKENKVVFIHYRSLLERILLRVCFSFSVFTHTYTSPNEKERDGARFFRMEVTI
ncbi:hypothetical protein PGB90_007643 [Kerria lacca]